VKTGQLSKPENASKRTADTGAMFSEAQAPLETERRIQGLARMNYMHNVYRKAGRIKNDDMVYTIGLLLTSPVKWVERFDWRPLTDAEKCALGVYWKDTGDHMDISWENLQPYMKGKPDDGLSWTEAVLQWSEDYEKETMVPAESNRELGQHTLDILLHGMPSWLRGFGTNIVGVVMEERLRKALM
jgi:hypothetical protein